jgi:hypothetical protein
MTALCAVPAGLRQRVAVPRAAEGRAGRVARGGAHRGRGLRRRRVPVGAACRRPPGRQRHTSPGAAHRRTDGLPQGLVDEHNLRISDQTYFFEACAAGPHGGPARRPRHRPDGRHARPGLGVRPRHRGHRAGLHRGRAGLLRADAGPGRWSSATRCCHATHKAWNWNRGETTDGGYTSTTPTWRARCAATRTCACWWPAAATTWARRTAPPTGRWRTWTSPPTWRRASPTTTTTPAT